MEWLNISANIISLLAALFSLFSWLKSRRIHKETLEEKERQNKKVKVVLQNGAKDLELPVELRRGEFSRAEVLGRLGMIPMKDKGKKFSIGFLSTLQFFHLVTNILAGNDDATLLIPCNDEEFAQFDIKKE